MEGKGIRSRKKQGAGIARRCERGTERTVTAGMQAVTEFFHKNENPLPMEGMGGKTFLPKTEEGVGDPPFGTKRRDGAAAVMEGMQDGNDGTYGIGSVGNKKCGTYGKGAAREAAFDAHAADKNGGVAQRSPGNIEQVAGIGSRAGIAFIVE